MLGRRLFAAATVNLVLVPIGSGPIVDGSRSSMTASNVEIGPFPTPAIQEAVLYKSRQALIPVSVLRLVTADSEYQFGFNPWIQMERHLLFQFNTEEVTLKRSTFSLMVRVAVLAYLISWLWRRF